MNDNKYESAALESAMRLVARESRMVPLSKWSVPSLVVLRALELSGVNADVVGAFYPLSHNQAAPVLSVRSNAIKTDPTATLVEEQVAALVAFGAVVDAGLAHLGNSSRAHWSCLRFPFGGCDEKIVAGLARNLGSAAQHELDLRGHEGERRPPRRTEILHPAEHA